MSNVLDQTPRLGSRDSARALLKDSSEAIFKALEEVSLLRQDKPKDILTKMAELDLIIALNQIEKVRVYMRKRRRASKLEGMKEQVGHHAVEEPERLV